MNKIKTILSSKKGSGELIGLAMVLIFIVLVLATPIKNIGTTMATKFNTLNTNLENNL